MLGKKKRDENDTRAEMDRATERLIGLVQIYFVQQILLIVVGKGEEKKQIGIMSLFHAIVYLFWHLDQRVSTREISKEKMIKVKSDIIEHFVKVSMVEQEITDENTELFVKLIYDLDEQIGCSQATSQQQALQLIEESLCTVAEIEKKKDVSRALSKLDRYIAKSIKKIA